MFGFGKVRTYIARCLKQMFCCDRNDYAEIQARLAIMTTELIQLRASTIQVSDALDSIKNMITDIKAEPPASLLKLKLF